MANYGEAEKCPVSSKPKFFCRIIQERPEDDFTPILQKIFDGVEEVINTEGKKLLNYLTLSEKNMRNEAIAEGRQLLMDLYIYRRAEKIYSSITGEECGRHWEKIGFWNIIIEP